MTVDTTDTAALLEQALATSGWYHTIELAPGAITPGWIDLRDLAPKLLPASLAGKRALDVGTFDGFWAYELERRGASSVVATDLGDFLDSDWKDETREALAGSHGGVAPGDRFRLVHRILRSSVEHRVCAIQDLDAGALGGPFDYVVVGSLLVHMRDPVSALERVRDVLVPGGRLLTMEPFDIRTTITGPRRPSAHLRILHTEFDWWVGNLAMWKGVLKAAGFDPVKRLRLYRFRGTTGWREWCVAHEATRPG